MGGRNKALLKVGGCSIVERIAETLLVIFPEVIIVTNTPEDFRFLGLPMVGDLKPGKGSLGGLYTGLRFCKGDYGFLVACDMPFLNRQAIAHMVSLIDDYEVVVPRIGGHWEPLHAIYSVRCIAHIERLLAAGDLKIINFFPQARLREIPEEDLLRFDPELRFTINLNTPEDLVRAQAMAQAVRQDKSNRSLI